MLVQMDILSPMLYLIESIDMGSLNVLDDGHYFQFWIDSTLVLISLLCFIRGVKLMFDFERLQHQFELKWRTIIRSHKTYVPWTTSYPLVGNVRFLVLTACVTYCVLFSVTFIVWELG